MTETEAQWFALLTKDREDSANTFAKPSMRGVQRSVVDKYSDQAHFIYELLQNADDAGATTAIFRLEKDGLYFQHNGSIHFTLSDPAREEDDSREGRLGHINAITSIANSNKNESSIGKFGVGFKAVFQYTETPHIYHPKIRFKIERFIVPVLLKKDLAGRGAGETEFFFPFDHRNKSPEETACARPRNAARFCRVETMDDCLISRRTKAKPGCSRRTPPNTESAHHRCPVQRR